MQKQTYKASAFDIEATIPLVNILSGAASDCGDKSMSRPIDNTL